jgi:plasmid stabilization system protein ParE
MTSIGLVVNYLAGAHRDFDEGFDWYLERSPQTAVRFADAIDAALIVIAKNPTRYARLKERYRQFRLKRFPFSIVYRAEVDRIIIVEIAHAKRSELLVGTGLARSHRLNLLGFPAASASFRSEC